MGMAGLDVASEGWKKVWRVIAPKFCRYAKAALSLVIDNRGRWASTSMYAADRHSTYKVMNIHCSIWTVSSSSYR
jgi:hypothetical protein